MQDRQHIVSAFDEELHRIESLILEMGGLVETQIEDAAEALVRRDVELGDAVHDRDRHVDTLNARIDEEVVRLLALRQPLAEDLRFAVSALKIAAALERIGDYAKNIGKRNTIIARSEVLQPASRSIRRMSALARDIVHDVLDAYLRRDLPLAEEVRRRDQEVDHMHNALFRELLTYMIEDPRNITPCMHMLFVAKNVERIGDHATAIAEQVAYMLTGEMPGADRPKADATSFTAPGREDEKQG